MHTSNDPTLNYEMKFMCSSFFLFLLCSYFWDAFAFFCPSSLIVSWCMTMPCSLSAIIYMTTIIYRQIDTAIQHTGGLCNLDHTVVFVICSCGVKYHQLICRSTMYIKRDRSTSGDICIYAYTDTSYCTDDIYMYIYGVCIILTR
jgi:hypothetical protein